MPSSTSIGALWLPSSSHVKSKILGSSTRAEKYKLELDVVPSPQCLSFHVSAMCTAYCNISYLSSAYPNDTVGTDLLRKRFLLLGLKCEITSAICDHLCTVLRQIIYNVNLHSFVRLLKCGMRFCKNLKRYFYCRLFETRNEFQVSIIDKVNLKLSIIYL